MNNSLSKRAFTLLEVLVALVVFAIGVSGLLVALARHIKTVSFSEDHTTAVQIASREMATLRRFRFVPPPEEEGENGRFSWIIRADEINEELPGTTDNEQHRSRGLKPFFISVQVSWSEVENGKQNHKIELKGIELFNLK